MVRVLKNDKCAMNNRKIRIAYICHFSNADIHRSLPLHLDVFTKLLLAKNKLPLTTDEEEYAVWNTNAINELKKYCDIIDLHIIAPSHYLKPKTFFIKKDGVNYHFFRSVDDFMPRVIIRNFFNIPCMYLRNREIIKSFIKEITPDLVHVVGIENPYYALSVLDIPTSIPIIAQLQTLLNAPEFKKTSQSIKGYLYRSKIERIILEHVTYVGLAVKYYNQIIHNQINENSIFLRMILALAEPVDTSQGKKEYDFVYYANDISKAADLAIEAFILASKKRPGLKMNIVGGYSLAYKMQLDKLLSNSNLSGNVYFSGKLPTHDDVINQIRLSRFALLPLKMDLVSGTIREAMSNGLPVLTTITEGTPKLNEKNECVLLSPIGDHQALADNMCRLLDNSELVEKLRINAGNYMKEKDSNERRVKRYVEIYNAVLEHFHRGEPIPNELLS